jgi:polyhydroxybutyrate depolymerase
MWRLCLLALIWAGGQAVAEQQLVTFGTRSYLIDLADHPSGAMIVALHAAASTPTEFRDKTGLSARALPKGYAVIYPQGTGSPQHLSWNGFYCCGSAQVERVDDIRFLDLVIADAAARFGLDPAKVYLTGMSNGSIMAETYAARRAGHVKAVAGVAGTIDLARTPAAAVPLLHIHGLDDTMVPYGAKGPGYGTKHVRFPFTPVPVEIAAFLATFGPLQSSSRTIDRVADGTSITEDDYVDAAGRTDVRLITVTGGQHVWPAPGRMGQGNTQEISATSEVLRFFDEHP